MPQWLATLLAPIVGLIVLAGIGHNLADRWQERQKRRDLDLDALGVFYELYGEFFACWKLWDDHLAKAEAGSHEISVSPDLLLNRATVAEGRLEALIVKITSERVLGQREEDILGAFRQAYKTLRKAIMRRDSLSETYGWSSSAADEYAAFKGLASAVTSMLTRPANADARNRGFTVRPQYPAERSARRALRQVTSNYYEARRHAGQTPVWQRVADNHGLLSEHERDPLLSDDPPAESNTTDGGVR